MKTEVTFEWPLSTHFTSVQDRNYVVDKIEQNNRTPRDPTQNGHGKDISNSETCTSSGVYNHLKRQQNFTQQCPGKLEKLKIKLWIQNADANKKLKKEWWKGRSSKANSSIDCEGECPDLDDYISSDVKIPIQIKYSLVSC